jgi:hypothetical protein
VTRLNAITQCATCSGWRACPVKAKLRLSRLTSCLSHPLSIQRKPSHGMEPVAPSLAGVVKLSEGQKG